MNIKYTTEKLEKSFRTIQILALVIIAYSIIKAFFKDFSDFESFDDLGRYLDIILMPIGALFLLLSATNRKNKLAGNHISFRADGFSFKSNGNEHDFQSWNDIHSITIKLKTIEIVGDDNFFTISLDDYKDFAEKKAIKADFEKVKMKLEMR